MLKKILATTALLIVTLSSFAIAKVEYSIQDIGTLNTHSSQAIALNNEGGILGWYNIDGTKEGKHFFVREHDGSFHAIMEDMNVIYENIPLHLHSNKINWRFLTDDGKAYGTLTLPNSTPLLFMWDKLNGVRKLGYLPNNEISAINNQGQVLIQSVAENENGLLIYRPVIWKNGNITRLKGLEGDLGIESEKSLGLSINNKGEVVGQSYTNLVYKNDFYKQWHATMWGSNGTAIDLHKKISKATTSVASAINDHGEFIIGDSLFLKDGKSVFINGSRRLNNNYLHDETYVKNKDGQEILNRHDINSRVFNDSNSIWINVSGFTNVNDAGEVIAKGETIYGEQHAVLLIPVNP